MQDDDRIATTLSKPTRRNTIELAGAAAAASLLPAAARAQTGRVTLDSASDVLIVVDLQNDFLPGGALAVPQGDEVIAPINALAGKFRHVLFTQDWHPAGHISFASSHPGKKPFELIDLPYGKQVLWPDHCIWGTKGAELSDRISIPHGQLVIRKGFDRNIDSYSGFVEADRKTKTGLAGYMAERDLKRAFVVGLATDFCVGWTALDARAAGLPTFVIEDACRGIDAQGSLAAAWKAMAEAGVGRIASSAIG
jgi:nicotinamidase/pyrazinamidase